ncbi:hypothetical protein H4582DRAFT_2083718 [Lactarius indigo]|nr:hypothetical protein H4582DRAFT_2083718 [Lactarius indigo]
MTTAQTFEPRSPWLAQQDSALLALYRMLNLPVDACFSCVPCAAQDMPSAAAPRLELRIASILYGGLRPAALFGTLGGALKEPVLVLALDVGMHTRGPLLGALGNTGIGLELLELSLRIIYPLGYF